MHSASQAVQGSSPGFNWACADDLTLTAVSCPSRSKQTQCCIGHRVCLSRTVQTGSFDSMHCCNVVWSPAGSCCNRQMKATKLKRSHLRRTFALYRAVVMTIWESVLTTLEYVQGIDVDFKLTSFSFCLRFLFENCVQVVWRFVISTILWESFLDLTESRALLCLWTSNKESILCVTVLCICPYT